jgi:hypothetical protein
MIRQRLLRIGGATLGFALLLGAVWSRVPARAAARPAITAVVCQGHDDNLTPLGVTKSFSSDNAAAYVVMTAKTPPEKGHTITVKIVTADGTLVAAGSPIATDGNADIFSTGFYLAGRDWARNGGKFAFKLFWDADTEPLASLPFTVTVCNRWALLIGIKDYPPEGEENDLAGCDLDVQNMEALLREAFGIQASHITKLQDLKATKAGIEKAITDLSKKAAANDSVIIYYSGHGAQVPDLDGDEDDGYDEAIVPAEVLPGRITTEGDINRLITDDRLAELLGQFKTTNLTLFFDSCHSGTVVRAGKREAPKGIFQGRFREFNFSKALIDKALDAGDNKTVQFEESLDADGKYVVLSGCRPYETSGCNDEVGGYFTALLVPELATANGANWDTIIRRVQHAMTDNDIYSQYPVAEGAVGRLPFSLQVSGDQAPYIRPFLAVAGACATPKQSGDAPVLLRKSTATGNIALIEAQHGLSMEHMGAIYDVYPNADLEFTGKPSGQVRLTGERIPVSITDDKGKVVGKLRFASATILSGTVAQNDRLVARAVPFPAAQPRALVYIDPDIDKATLEKIRPLGVELLAQLKAAKGLTMLESASLSELDYLVEPTLVDGQPWVYIWGRNGSEVAAFDGSVKEIVAKTRGLLLGRHEQVTRLMRLANPSPAFRLRAVSANANTPRKPGDIVTLRAQSDVAGYCTVIAVGEGVTPQLVAASTRIEAGKPFVTTATIPAGVKANYGLRVLVTDGPLALDGFAASATPTDTLFAALRARYADAAGPTYLGTNGWATETVWFAVGSN